MLSRSIFYNYHFQFENWRMLLNPAKPLTKQCFSLHRFGWFYNSKYSSYLSVLSSASINSVMAQFQFQLFVLFIVLKTCRGALQCEDDACGRSTSRYTEPHESKTQSVIEEIPYMISPEDFYYKFVAKHRPLVLRRTATNWPANKVRWTILFMFCLDLLTHFALHLKIAISLGLFVFMQKETFEVSGNHGQKFDGGGRWWGGDKIRLCSHGLSSCSILPNSWCLIDGKLQIVIAPLVMSAVTVKYKYY